MDVKTFYETRFEVSDSYPLLVRIRRLPLARLFIYSYVPVSSGARSCQYGLSGSSLEALLGISIRGELSIFQFPLVVFSFPYPPPHTPSFADGDAQPVQILQLGYICFILYQGSRPNYNILQSRLTTYLPQRRPRLSQKKMEGGRQLLILIAVPLSKRRKDRPQTTRRILVP